MLLTISHDCSEDLVLRSVVLYLQSDTISLCRSVWLKSPSRSVGCLRKKHQQRCMPFPVAKIGMKRSHRQHGRPVIASESSNHKSAPVKTQIPNSAHAKLRLDVAGCSGVQTLSGHALGCLVTKMQQRLNMHRSTRMVRDITANHIKDW